MSTLTPQPDATRRSWYNHHLLTVEADFTGGQLLPLTVGDCILNDIYREATELGVD